MRGVLLLSVAAIGFHFLTEAWLWLLLPAFRGAYNVGLAAILAALATLTLAVLAGTCIRSRLNRKRRR